MDACRSTAPTPWRRASIATAALLLATLAGCGGMPSNPAPENSVASGFAVPPAPALIAVAPLPGEHWFLEAIPLVRERLDAQLRALGHQTVLIGDDDLSARWSAAVGAIGGLFDPVTGRPRDGAQAQAMARLASGACAPRACDLVLLFRTEERSAQLADDLAIWDDQRRRIPISSRFGIDSSFDGTTPAMSVHVVALHGDGRPAFERHGGASVPFRIDLVDQKSRLRPELFDDSREIGDGVRIAIAPLLPDPAP